MHEKSPIANQNARKLPSHPVGTLARVRTLQNFHLASLPPKTHNPPMPSLTTARIKTDARATHVAVDEDSLTVTLSDGRTVTAPLEWFPRLRDATPQQKQEWRLIGPGIGIHWEAIDEDISMKSLLASDN
jgi:hypothetical protein